MKKLSIRLLLIESLALAAAWGQSVPISSVQVLTDPPGARFYVDGQLYYAAQTFLWPQGSKHLLQFPTTITDGVATNYQQSLDGNVRYQFGGWVDNAGILQTTSSSTQTVTADPAVKSIKGNVTVLYHVALRFSNSPVTMAPCAAPGAPPTDQIRSGIVMVAGACYVSDADVYLAAGPVTLNAYPYPGWLFTGWNLNGTVTSSYLTTLTITGPATLRPTFTLGKRVQFVTSPFGMQLLIDRTPTPTSAKGIVDGQILQPGSGAAPCTQNLTLGQAAPATVPALCLGEFDFLPGSQHAIAAVTPQLDNTGKYWVFDSFSNGQGQGSVYVAGNNTSTKDVVTANFVPGIQTAFLTSPSGLKLQVDGNDKWANYNFIWAANSTHTVTAPAVQTDAKGRKWTFQGWSNNGPATQTVTADPANPNSRVTAIYAGLAQVKVTTIPTGIKLNIDGNDCVSPCVLDRQTGSQLAIVAPASLPQSDTSRLDFQGWGDGGGVNTRTYTVSSDTATIWANYGPSYRVAVASDPADAVDIRFDPPTSDGYYPGDTAVTVTATARPGYKFRRWGGDLAGVYPVAQLTISGPRTVTAALDRVPYIAPAGIRNAAGLTPDGTVAPGSIIAITGESLAPSLITGPVNPLSQTIGGIVVTVNDRYLPLLFVSPKQINAQVISDLPDGVYTLKVMNGTQDTVTGTFTVSRNSPGLFTRSDTDQPISLASHEDGTPITTDSPAHRGETVSIFGTGFGPYDQKVIDGFVIPDTANYRLIDPVQVNAADQQLQPVWTGAAPGYVGTTITKLKIDDSIPATTNVEVTVSVNGKSSNKVLLPVE